MIRRMLQVVVLAWIAHLPQHAYAHEVRPGYLELQQTAPETWSLLWKVPAQGDMRLAIHPQLPETCALLSEPIAFQTRRRVCRTHVGRSAKAAWCSARSASKASQPQ